MFFKKIMQDWKVLWECLLSDQQKNKIKVMLDSNEFIFYFKYQNEIYAGSEGNRVTFAQMKNPDKDNPGWAKEANFMATNLNKLGLGEQTQMVFGHKELSSIEIISKDQAYKTLEKFFEKEKKD